MEEEIWGPISGYVFYQVSNMGRVRSFRCKKIKPLKQSLNKKGYLTTWLVRSGKQKKFLVHRLVALAFIPNPENKPQINHIYGIKTDNRASELCWCTNGENQIHAIQTGLRKIYKGDSNKNTFISDEDVLAIVNSPLPSLELSTKYNITNSYVHAIKRGQTRSETTGIKWSPKPKTHPDDIVSIFNEPGKIKDIAQKFNITIRKVYAIKSGKEGSKFTGKIRP